MITKGFGKNQAIVTKGYARKISDIEQFFGEIRRLFSFGKRIINLRSKVIKWNS